MPFEQDAQKACARSIGRKKPNYDYNKNKKVRPLDIVVLSSDEDDTNPVDDPLLSATNITEGKLHENQVVLNESPTSSSNEASDDFKKSIFLSSFE